MLLLCGHAAQAAKLLSMGCLSPMRTTPLLDTVLWACCRIAIFGLAFLIATITQLQAAFTRNFHYDMKDDLPSWFMWVLIVSGMHVLGITAVSRSCSAVCSQVIEWLLLLNFSKRAHAIALASRLPCINSMSAKKKDSAFRLEAGSTWTSCQYS